MNNLDIRYNECLNYLYSQLPMYQRIGAAAYKVDIDNTVKLAEYFGNPQNELKCIHIAGTNGKTSVSHYLSSILTNANYKTGLYTSPHLVDFRERIMVNSQMIDKQYVCDFVENNKEIFEKIKPSFFEITVIMAFCWFRDTKTDYAVIEVGLGGRLDSTNIINPILSIITNIGLDHTQFLGTTLPEIASEKAGIIKQNVPVIISETQPETSDVFLQKAKEMNAPIYFADKLINVHEVEQTVKKLKVKSTSSLTNLTYKVSSNLVGSYEIKNIKAVLVAVELLRQQNILISYEALKQGLKHTVLRGRWDIINKKPLVVCDTAHNFEGITEVLKMINNFNYNQLHIVYGSVNDKDIHKIVDILPENAKYYLCKPNIPRGLDIEILSQKFKEKNLNYRTFNSCGDALVSAMLLAHKEDIIYVGGSTFVVAEILELISE
ncbi:MAG: bifunctional folylpolyglutamate synthase/dihydrofolate synthase [Bacteroidales bacterium]|jgi:dihydrofolate synthase/folylpolyglutamate synthase